MEAPRAGLQPTTAIWWIVQPGLPYSLFLPAALAFFQRALGCRRNFRTARSLIFRSAFFTGFAADFRPLTFAHRALCAASNLCPAGGTPFAPFLRSRNGNRFS